MHLIVTHQSFAGWRAHSGRAERYQQPIVQICFEEYLEDMKIDFPHRLPNILENVDMCSEGLITGVNNCTLSFIKPWHQFYV